MTTEVKDKPAEQTILTAGESYSKRKDELVPAADKPANLMQALAAAAMNPAMDVAKVERLYAMHKEMMAREAEGAWNDAMAHAQANVVPISKNRENSHTKSSYATLDAINEAIVPIYSAEGLSVSFDTFSPERDKDMPPLEKGWHRVIAIVSHRGGHSRKYHLDAPLDDAGKDGTKNKTGIQAMGSTVSYLRRYLVCMIFNVATADDKDGNRTGGNGGKRMEEKTLADHLAAMDGCANEAEMMAAFAKAYNACETLKDKDSQRVLMAKRDECRRKLKGGRRS